MSTDTLAEKIPDIYFDWFARLLPGLIGVCFYFYISSFEPVYKASYFFVYGVIAYLVGHIVQPLSSWLTEKIQNVVTPQEIEDLYKEAKHISEKSSLCAKVSKAHAEAVGMFSSFILLITISIFLKKIDLIPFILIVYFLWATIERAVSRKRKIDDLKVS